MLITNDNLAGVFQGFRTSFNKGFEGAKSHYADVAMIATSSAEDETYAWLGQFPKLREWVGERIVRNLMAHGYKIVNRKFEETIAVGRPKIEDDRYGIFDPMFREMGKAAAEYPDELVFSLLGMGFSEECYDGQYFFDVDHPVRLDGEQTVSVSNVQAGAGAPWFLLDCSRAFKPLVFQERIKPVFTALDKESDHNVFWQDEYIYGCRARGAAGFGFWQLAFGSKAELNAENYEAARAAMLNMKGDGGRLLGIKPDTLVVGPGLEGAAMRLVNNGTRIVTVDGTPVPVTNEWAGTAKPIVTAWVGA
ncbi:MAG: Mu-like prophage major head subunit gpT family protein [Magnetospirillum sp. WYHS-4]